MPTERWINNETSFTLRRLEESNGGLSDKFKKLLVTAGETRNKSV